ncbi:MAG: hypothetical protein M1812_000063 [Candelaria pacifica]|nr:MAG: hypothetical protein M1812_000063 [Candelaria pacifica]
MPKQAFKSTKTNRASPVAVGSMQDENSQRARTRAWNPRDDEILMASRAQGMNWLPIQQAHFPTKTDNACRKRHERLMEKRSAEDWDAEKMESLAKAYLDMRKEMWGVLAEKVGEKWQVVEAKCLEKGLKNLQSAGRTALRKEKLASDLDDSGVAEMDGETSQDTQESRRERCGMLGDHHAPHRDNSIASILHPTSQS